MLQINRIFWTPSCALGSWAQLFTTSFLAIVLLLPVQMPVSGRDGWFHFKSSLFFLPLQPQRGLQAINRNSLTNETSGSNRTFNIQTEVYITKAELAVNRKDKLNHKRNFENKCTKGNSKHQKSFNTPSHQHTNHWPTVCIPAHRVPQHKCQIQYQWGIQTLAQQLKLAKV